MARKLRVQYPGAIYHVMNRGDRREAIFKDDFDRHRFLKTLDEALKSIAKRLNIVIRGYVKTRQAGP